MNTKWIMDFNVYHKTVKLLEKKIGERLQDLGLSKESLDMT